MPPKSNASPIPLHGTQLPLKCRAPALSTSFMPPCRTLLTASLKPYINCPPAAHSGQPLAVDNTIFTGFLEASNLFTSIRLPARPIATDVERVVVPPTLEPPPTASLQRVISTNPPLLLSPPSSFSKVNAPPKHLPLSLYLFNLPL